MTLAGYNGTITFAGYTTTKAKIWHCGNCGAMMTTKRNKPKQRYIQPFYVVNGKSTISDNYCCEFCMEDE